MEVLVRAYSGTLQKLRAELNPSHGVEYYLPIGEQEIYLNAWLGKTLNITYRGLIQCIACNRISKKSFQQGYCFPCSQTLARCDICIVRPEKCHYRFGTCREPQWAKTHCLIPHIVYLANTSGIKVGITRETQIPTRWIDQGAVVALPIARVENRYHAGLIEVFLAKHVADKTDWRKMLKNEFEEVDLEAARGTHHALLQEITDTLFELDEKTNEKKKIELVPLYDPLKNIQYPVLEYPSKIVSINLDKNNDFTGKLLGIKGQYLIFDIGVINIRNFAGYEVSIEI